VAEPLTVSLPADIGLAALYILFKHLDAEASIEGPNQDELKSLRDTVDEWIMLFRDNAADIGKAMAFFNDKAVLTQRLAAAFENIERLYKERVTQQPSASAPQQVIAIARREAHNDSDNIEETVAELLSEAGVPLSLLLLMDLEAQRKRRLSLQSLSQLKADFAKPAPTNQLLTRLLSQMIRENMGRRK